MVKNVYFDTNVFIHSHDNSYGITSEVVQELRQAVESRKINIFLGVHNLEEVLQRLRTSPLDSVIKIGHMLNLTNTAAMLKPPELLVPDEIKSYAFRLPKPSPYIEIDPEMAAQLQLLCNPDEIKIRELLSIMGETQIQIEEFKNKMKDAQERVLEETHGLSAGHIPFIEYFEKLAPDFAEALVYRAGVLEECKRRGIDGILELNSVKVAAGVNLSYTYALTFEGRVPKVSDSRDKLHGITASAVDIFVSHDKGLRRLLARVPKVPFETLDIYGLLLKTRES